VKFAINACLAQSLLLAAAPVSGELLCSVGSRVLDFGAYSVIVQAGRPISTAITVTCTSLRRPSQGIVRLGIGPSGTTNIVSRRQLGSKKGAGRLDYNIYSDPAMTAVLGDSPGINDSAQAVNLPAGGSVQLSFPVYGQIYPRQDVEPGVYTDVLRVTVSF
jgi:spore coat protein U-like protein